MGGHAPDALPHEAALLLRRHRRVGPALPTIAEEALEEHRLPGLQRAAVVEHRDARVHGNEIRRAFTMNPARSKLLRP